MHDFLCSAFVYEKYTLYTWIWLTEDGSLALEEEEQVYTYSQFS